MLAADYAFGAAVIFVIGCSLYFRPRIGGDRIAMQWGSDGKPTWSAPRWLALWGTVPFMLAVRCSIWLASTYDPQDVHGANPGLLIFSVIIAAVHVYTLQAAAKAD